MYGCVGTCALYGFLQGKSAAMLPRHAVFGKASSSKLYLCDYGTRRGRVRGHGALHRARKCSDEPLYSQLFI